MLGKYCTLIKWSAQKVKMPCKNSIIHQNLFKMVNNWWIFHLFRIFSINTVISHSLSRQTSSSHFFNTKSLKFKKSLHKRNSIPWKQLCCPFGDVLLFCDLEMSWEPIHTRVAMVDSAEDWCRLISAICGVCIEHLKWKDIHPGFTVPIYQSN